MGERSGAVVVSGRARRAQPARRRDGRNCDPSGAGIVVREVAQRA